MKPHTAPEVLLGSRHPSEEWLRRASRVFMGALGLRSPDAAQESDEFRLDKLRVGREALNLSKKWGDEALAKGLRLPRGSNLGHEASVEAWKPGSDSLIRWSMTVMSKKGAATEFQFMQSEPAAVPESFMLAEGGLGRRFYEEAEFPTYQRREMHRSVWTLLDEFCAYGEIAESDTDMLASSEAN